MASKKDDKKTGSGSQQRGKVGSVEWGKKNHGNSGTWWEDRSTGLGGRTSTSNDGGSLYGHFTERRETGVKETPAIQQGERDKFPKWARDAVDLADKLFDDKSSKE